MLESLAPQLDLDLRLDQPAIASAGLSLDKTVKLDVKSVTADNGPENAEHALIAAILNLQFYFCHPYHSWEKGTVENTNKEIRKDLPKGSDISKYP